MGSIHLRYRGAVASTDPFVHGATTVVAPRTTKVVAERGHAPPRSRGVRQPLRSEDRAPTLGGMTQPGFVVLYRWKLKSGHEEAFAEAWAEMTSILLARGSLGSRLHHGDDDTWYAYAQWPSAEARMAAFESSLPPNDAGDRMDAAVAERFPEIVLDVVADFLAD